jgi:hypothetical protein
VSFIQLCAALEIGNLISIDSWEDGIVVGRVIGIRLEYPDDNRITTSKFWIVTYQTEDKKVSEISVRT